MMPTPPVYDQRTLLQRITQRKCSYRSCRQYFFSFTGLTILIFGIAVAGFSLGQRMFPLAMLLMTTATVFLIVLFVVDVDVRLRESEEVIPQQEDNPGTTETSL